MQSKGGAVWMNLAVILALAVTFGPAIFGEAKDPWTQFVFGYQTLITGLFAVFAAFITLRQMRESEERQQVRHLEALLVTVRDDRRAINRLRDFLPERLPKDVVPLHAYADLAADEADVDREEPWSRERKVAFYAAAFAAIRIGNTLNDPRVQRCTEMFTSEMHEEIINCEASTRMIRDLVPPELRYAGYYLGDAIEFDHRWAAAYVPIIIADIANAAERVAADIEKWSRQLPGV